MIIRELLQEQVDRILDALHPRGITFVEWYSDHACSFDVFEFSSPDGTDREAVSFAYGYLRGAHEIADVTMLELLESHNVFFGSRKRRAARARKG